MSKKNTRTNIGRTKRSTDEMINDAIAQQNDWMANRRGFARRFLKKMDMFARPNPKKEVAPAAKPKPAARKNNRSGVRAYWFPILCAIFVIMVAIWVAFVRTTTPRIVIANAPAVEVPVTSDSALVAETPSFDIVRIEPDGNIVIAGRWVADENISVAINDKIVATVRTNARGEFVYAPHGAIKSGNYTILLIGADGTKSADRVFVYISEHGYKNSLSLLMTADGSTLLQSPTLRDGDLVVSKIDYLASGRIVVSGDAMPRLRVSLTLNDKYIGFARTSDHRHFGIGADVEKLQPGHEYTLAVRMHDADGTTVATIEHKFVMPEMTGDDDTFYTVRRGDCLWVIARNFLRRGVLFSIIADKNNIKNPNLIFPKQKLKIPVSGK